MFDVSIIIVNWNVSDFLRKCLKSIYDNTAGVSFEIFVIDNASSDNSVAMIKTNFPGVHIIENSENKGFASANNQGITIAKGRYILLLNPDTEIIDNAIAKTTSFADANPNAAIVGCKVLNSDRTLQRTCFMFPSVLNMLLSTTYLYKIFPKNKFFGREEMTWWGRNDVREVDVVTGCFMLIRHNAIKQIGFMDERFFIYGEETDLCYRLKKVGWKILFTHEAQIIHLGGQSSRQIAPEMALQLRGSILQFMEKHYSRLHYYLACVLVWLFFAARVPLWFVKSIRSKTESEYCRIRLRTYLTGMKKLVLQGGKGLCFRQGK